MPNELCVLLQRYSNRALLQLSAVILLSVPCLPVLCTCIAHTVDGFYPTSDNIKQEASGGLYFEAAIVLLLLSETGLH